MDLQEFYDWLFNQRPDGDSIPLKGTGIVLALLLIAGHLWALLRAESAKKVAQDFPRSRSWGIGLLIAGAAWTWFLIRYMDMADFHPWRQTLLMGLPVAGFLIICYVPEFLAVRALGSLMLLAASPVLHAAFLQPQLSRLLLPILAYVWIIVGMFLVGMPFLLRDWIQWLSKTPLRWQAASLGGLAYGVAMLLASLMWY